MRGLMQRTTIPPRREGRRRIWKTSLRHLHRGTRRSNSPDREGLPDSPGGTVAGRPADRELSISWDRPAPEKHA